MNRAQSKRSRKNRFCTPFSPPRPPVGLRTRLHFLALVSTAAAHRLHFITSLGICNCENISLLIHVCLAEGVTTAVLGRDLSLHLPISSPDGLDSQVPKPQDPGVTLTLTRLSDTPWYLFLGSYPATPLTLSSLETFAKDRRSLAMKVCRLCRSQWQVGD